MKLTFLSFKPQSIRLSSSVSPSLNRPLSASSLSPPSSSSGTPQPPFKHFFSLREGEHTDRCQCINSSQWCRTGMTHNYMLTVESANKVAFNSQTGLLIVTNTLRGGVFIPVIPWKSVYYTSNCFVKDPNVLEHPYWDNQFDLLSDVLHPGLELLSPGPGMAWSVGEAWAFPAANRAYFSSTESSRSHTARSVSSPSLWRSYR